MMRLARDFAVAAVDEWVSTHARPDRLELTHGSMLNLANVIEKAIVQASEGWQSIETAPKDRPILLFSKYELGVGIGIWWRNAWHWWADGAALEYMSDFGCEYKQYGVPSHWMPLPDPPQDSAPPCK